ncbi:tenascin-like [Diachasmimorpha longicaudata]|uniref:tenascin-like n=1 Tax=Diachasmimorpha longicaudata TaxID=58733 RepID=UPI0030B8C82F
MERHVKILLLVLGTVLGLQIANAQTSVAEPSTESSEPDPECTARCTGGPNDKCTLCGTACPLTCDRPEPGICTKQCVVNVCRCDQGYVRNARGRCVRPNQCPRRDPRCTRRCTGGRHDRCTLCGSACPRTCDRPNPEACTLQCIVNTCECERGYVRNAAGRCVRPDQCPQSRQPQCTRRCTGGPHDRCTLCGSACPLSCDRPNPRICTLQCLINVCECDRGFVRNSEGQCVRPDQCPSSGQPGQCTRRCTGGPNDECTFCGSACPPTCDRSSTMLCTPECRVNVCQCRRGYLRNSEGQCVRPDQCPPAE